MIWFNHCWIFFACSKTSSMEANTNLGAAAYCFALFSTAASFAHVAAASLQRSLKRAKPCTLLKLRGKQERNPGESHETARALTGILPDARSHQGRPGKRFPAEYLAWQWNNKELENCTRIHAKLHADALSPTISSIWPWTCLRAPTWPELRAGIALTCDNQGHKTRTSPNGGTRFPTGFEHGRIDPMSLASLAGLRRKMGLLKTITKVEMVLISHALLSIRH